MRTITRDIVSVVLFSKDGKLLQALQDPNGGGVYPGCWGIIGGGVEEGEQKIDALNREVTEEAGIDISAYPAELIDESSGSAEKTLKETGERVFCNMRFYTYKVVLHDQTAEEINIVLDEEHTEYRWSLPSELKSLKLTPPSVDLFAKLDYFK